MRPHCARSFWLPIAAAFILFSAPATAVELELVSVGDPGNAADTPNGVGAVEEIYWISKYEVTNAQYAEFLNAAAVTDTNGLYNMFMSSGFGGITRSGSSGSYSYSPIAGREDMPVNFVSFWNATRFANWLHNEQPTGMQGNATTEDGAYTLTPAGMADNSVARNPGATFFLPSEDEWYKAAYYQRGGTGAGYWNFPASSDAQTACALPATTANAANCDFAVGDLTDIGSYAGAASPSGTFDQGGNVWEWNEKVTGLARGVRGGGFNVNPVSLSASIQTALGPAGFDNSVGFRLTRPLSAQPIPSLSRLGMALLAGSLGIASWQMRRS